MALHFLHKNMHIHTYTHVIPCSTCINRRKETEEEEDEEAAAKIHHRR